MVGREGQLAELRQLAAAAAAGRPQVAVVLGEAGIGKTRLVDELVPLAERDGFLTAWGGCASGAARALPLAPVREVLDSLRRTLGPRLGRLAGGGPAALEALAPLLGTGAAPEDAAAASQAQVFDAIARLLRDVGRARGLLIVVEDVHWADETSRDLLEFLARSLRDERVLLVVTARTDDPAFETCRALVADLAALRHGSRVELARLSSAEVAEQLASLRGDRATDADLARVVGLTEGVPLLVEEVVDADLDDVARLADLLLGHRIARLTPPARLVVETAAGAVLDASPEQLARATPLDAAEFDAAFAETVAAGVLVRRGGTVAFRHALLREAAQSSTAPNAETAIHRRWSSVLGDAPRGLDELVAAAYHRRRAGDVGGALAACVKASEAARSIGAYAEERRLLLEAAELWPSVPDAEEHARTPLFEIYAAAGWSAHVSAGDPEEAERLLDLSAAVLPADASPDVRAMFRLLWHRTRSRAQDRLSTAEVLSCVADVAMEPPTDSAVLACLEAVDALLLRDGDLPEAEQFAQRALASAEAMGRLDLSIRALNYLAMAEARSGQEEAARRTADRAVALGERLGDPFELSEALEVRAELVWLAGGDAREIERRLVELLGGDRPGPMPGRWGFAQADYARCLIDSGEWDEAERALGSVIVEVPHARVVPWAELLADHLTVLRGGTPAGAADVAARRRSKFEGITFEWLVACRELSCDIAARLGDHPAARAEVASVIGDDRITVNPSLLHPLIWVAARIEAELAATGNDSAPEQGDAVVVRMRELLQLAPPRNERDAAYARHACADLERRSGTDTPEQWTAVVDGWRRVGHPFPLATALVRAGASYAAAGRSDEARDALQEAVEIGERLGARPLVEEAAAVAAAAHLRLRGGPVRSAVALGLSERELEVLRLVAEGASNGAIARALVISPKTASVHVSHILAKLGVANRGEAAAIAHRAGLALDAAPSG